GVRWVGARTDSWLAAPIPAGDRVLGVLSVADRKRHAFTESDERLLSTLSTSMGVALENARLFGETKRLLSETNERAAELAIINEIGSALAEQLDFQAVIDLVGYRVNQIFENPTAAMISLYDAASGRIDFPFAV